MRGVTPSRRSFLFATVTVTLSLPHCRRENLRGPGTKSPGARDAGTREEEVCSCRCTPTAICRLSGNLFTNQPFDFSLHGFVAAKLLLMQPVKDIGIGFIVKLQLDLGCVPFVIPVLLIGPKLLLPCFLLHCITPPPGFS